MGGADLAHPRGALLKTCRPESKETASGFARPFSSSLMRQNSDNRRSPKAGLAVGHFLGHVEDEFAVPIFHFAQQATKFVEKACIFADASPGNVIGRLALRKIRQLRRFLTVIKEVIERSEERRVGKSVDLGGRRITKKKKRMI